MELTKTLKFLKDITGEDFKVSYQGTHIKRGTTYIYSITDNLAWVEKDKISLSLEGDGDTHWERMSPQEFVDKMTKGEYTWN